MEYTLGKNAILRDIGFFVSDKDENQLFLEPFQGKDTVLENVQSVFVVAESRSIRIEILVFLLLDVL